MNQQSLGDELIIFSMCSPAHCHGRQVCQITEVANSLGEPCPQLGSYLSLDYHCKDGWFPHYYNALR